MRTGAALLLSLTAVLARAGETDAPKMEFSRVAVLVYPQSAGAKTIAGSAQARLEQILLDNGIEVTDRDESAKIKNIWKKLEDPGYFITADDFVNNAQKFGLDGIARLYLGADVTQVMDGFYSATAQADVRLVDEQAKVSAHTSYPMGAPGRPPSDGLTAQAAMLNAVQRAVDEAAQELGLSVSEPASPRAMAFQLEGPMEAARGAQVMSRPPRDLGASFVELAPLASGRNTTEEITCADLAPGGDVAVVGGSLSQMAGRYMMFGSRVHLLDLAQEREITVFTTRELGRKPKEHRGSSKVLDCLFVHSWRYLAAVTGDVLSLWDTERGLNLAEVLLPFGTDAANLELLRGGDGLYLRVQGDDKQQALYHLRSGARDRQK